MACERTFRLGEGYVAEFLPDPTTDAKWQAWEALLDLHQLEQHYGTLPAVGELRTRWKRSVPWVKARIEDYGALRPADVPETVHAADGGSAPSQVSGSPPVGGGAGDGPGTAGEPFQLEPPPKDRRRRKRRLPHDFPTPPQRKRIEEYVAGHRLPEVRALYDEFDEVLEACLLWHEKHDALRRNFEAAVKEWFLREPRKRAGDPETSWAAAGAHVTAEDDEQ